MKKNNFRQSKAATVLSRVAEKTLSGSFDWWLFTLTVVILSIGLIMVLSASGIVAEIENGDKYYFFKRQVAFAGVGLLPCCRATGCTNCSIRRSFCRCCCC